MENFLQENVKEWTVLQHVYSVLDHSSNEGENTENELGMKQIHAVM